MNITTVVTRFAPSPTGYLHVGGARTALFSWLLARHLGGRFLLRIEDTDLARSNEESVRRILDDMRWLGLHWDNPQLVYQSKRLDVYNRIIADLIARGMAYKAYESSEELDAQRKLAERQKRAFIYRRPQLTDEQVKRYDAEKRPHVVRFAMPVREYRFHDVVLDKEVVLAGNQVQDFVIRKTDGMPTYHFAVVVDDAEMGVTHVLRGQEHLLNTINHIGLQEALGYARPIYGHLPIILNPDGSKMGKRDRDKKVRHHAQLWLKNKKTPTRLALATGRRGMDALSASASGWPTTASSTRRRHATGRHESHRPSPQRPPRDPRARLPQANGYLPEVLLNFLSLLGWNPGGDRERMSVEETGPSSSRSRTSARANAKFDRDKLLLVQHRRLRRGHAAAARGRHARLPVREPRFAA